MKKLFHIIFPLVRAHCAGLAAVVAFVLITLVFIHYFIGINLAIDGIHEGKLTYITSAIFVGVLTGMCGIKFYELMGSTSQLFSEEKGAKVELNLDRPRFSSSFHHSIQPLLQNRRISC